MVPDLVREGSFARDVVDDGRLVERHNLVVRDPQGGGHRLARFPFRRYLLLRV